MAKTGRASIDVTRGVIWKQLLTLCIPIFFSSFFQQAYALINTYIVGQFGGKAALGGIQSTTTLSELCVGFCVGLGAGCAVITGQYFGQRDHERLSRSVHTAMTFALMLGAFFSVAGVLFAEPMLRFLDTPQELLAEAVAYARCYFAAMIFTLAMNMGTALLRAVGDTKGPAVIIASGCVINVVFDLILVAGLRLEALGCGIATALTIAINCSMIVVRMMRAKGSWRLHPTRLGIDGPIFKNMISCGMPLGIQSAAYSISNLLVQASVNSFGANATTGWGLAGRLDCFIWMVVEALGVALTTFAAQNFGARNFDRMKQGYRTSIVMAFFIVGAMSAALFVFVGPLSRVFVDDAGVTSFTTVMIHYVAPFYAVFSIVENTSGLMRGAGVSFQPMVLTIVGTCVLRIVWVLAVLPIWHVVEALLLVYPVTWTVTAILFLLYYRFGTWLTRAHVRAAKMDVAI